MFSGIVESTARLVAVERDRTNIHFTFTCHFAHELSIDQSVAHNGVCLTVVSQTADQYVVTAMDETLQRSNLGLLQPGDEVNVERSMLMNGRLDGKKVENVDGSYIFTFAYEADRAKALQGYFTVEKGSVTVNGVSLTVCRPTDNTFEVCIIPYTYEHTNFHNIKEGSVVNLEFDILGKYMARLRHFEE